MNDVGRPLGILVVDDEAIIRMELAMDLSDHGFVVHEANNVESALAIIDAHPEIAGGVFDVHLSSDRTGFDLVRIVRGRRPDFAVVLITGSGFAMPADLEGHVMIAAKPADSRKIALAMRARLGLSDAA